MVDSSTRQRPVARQGRDRKVDTGGQDVAVPETYDRRRLTYSNTFDSTPKRLTIRAIEWLTGKISIIRMLRQYQRGEAPTRLNFWHRTMEIMRIDIRTPPEQIAQIPASGPVIIVANHPHGLVDGMVLADLVSRVRLDFKVLSRAILTGIDETAASFMISVPFQHDVDAQRKGIEMRAAAMKQLTDGGVVILFPSGVVAASETMFGPAVEAEWNVFTAKMIRRSGATVLPVYFPGQNSRWYQIANKISPVFRQGLLLHEIVRSCHKPQAPIVGKPLTDEQMAPLETDPRGFMAWLRAHTMSLADHPEHF